MNKPKLVFLGLLGAVFLLIGSVKSNISYGYIGIGTWSAGIIYYTLLQKYKEITSFLLGLAVLHAGVILLLIDRLSNPKLLGAIVFTAGVVVVLSSGFSDYMRRRRAKK